jgi:D-alanyl-lipoteichoic acid acyltransferase DltB (MBOAT superfamily)
MLFNSTAFAVFLPVVFILYWFVFNRRISLQNGLLLVASYFFYGWWDWRFLSLLFLSTLVDYVIGISLERTTEPRRRKLWLFISVATNLGVLGFFKYYNFFIDSWAEMLRAFGFTPNLRTLNIILPVGISFYTFQTLSYTIDIYRNKTRATSDFLAFAAFVSFFPQLVAGPIERASNLMPQFLRPRKFGFANGMAGLRQIGWGLVKKVVIADNCAPYVEQAFLNPAAYSGSELFLAVIYFAFQIYCDFSGYSDIARGTAKLFGFELMVNFRTPYFSRNIAEFWQRWHISLSTWFRDYVYIPLGGNRISQTRTILNVFVVFVLSGLWHGANWTFIVWGALNALYFIPLMLLQKHKKYRGGENGDNAPRIRELPAICLTFLCACFGWIFFRAESIGDAWKYLLAIFQPSLFSVPDQLRAFLPALLIFVIIEWMGRRKEYPLLLERNSFVSNVSYFVGITLLLVWFGNFGDHEFIYFQF